MPHIGSVRSHASQRVARLPGLSGLITPAVTARITRTTRDTTLSGIIPFTFTRNRLYIPAAVTPRAEPVHQVRDRQQVIGGERAAARRDDHERIRCHRIGPPGWQREQLPVLITQADPVLTPVLPVLDELEVPPGQRVEQVRHPDPAIPIAWTGCS